MILSADVTKAVEEVLQTEDLSIRDVLNGNTGALNPYHNNQHMIAVAYLALQFYEESLFAKSYGKRDPQLYARRQLELVLAALFHDFNHPGVSRPDELNIADALAAWDAFATTKQFNSERKEHVAKLIQCTQFPYTTSVEDGQMCCLRDADLLAATVLGEPDDLLFDLRREINSARQAPEEKLTINDMLKAQVKFHSTLQLSTEAARQLALSTIAKFIHRMTVVAVSESIRQVF